MATTSNAALATTRSSVSSDAALTGQIWGRHSVSSCFSSKCSPNCADRQHDTSGGNPLCAAACRRPTSPSGCRWRSAPLRTEDSCEISERRSFAGKRRAPASRGEGAHSGIPLAAHAGGMAGPRRLRRRPYRMRRRSIACRRGLTRGSRDIRERCTGGEKTGVRGSRLLVACGSLMRQWRQRCVRGEPEHRRGPKLLPRLQLRAGKVGLVRAVRKMLRL